MSIETHSILETDEAAAFDKGNEKPTWMYVNYFLADHNHPRHAYLFQLDGSQDMQSAVVNAVAAIKDRKTPVPGSPDCIVWEHYCYIVFVLDDDVDRLTTVDFIHKETKGNHTFSNGRRLKDFDNCTSLYYLNERKNKDGKALKPGEKELYRWKAHHSRRDGSRSDRTHENSGTNLGP